MPACSRPVSRWIVLINLRSDENGTSPTRGSRSIERRGSEAALARGHQERAFGRIALHRPPAVMLPDGRVVRAVGDGERALDLHPPSAVEGHRLRQLAPRPRARNPNPPNVTRPLAVTTTRTVISFFVSVPVLSDAITRRRAQRLDGSQVPHDGVAPRHALDTEREHRGDDRRQAFRHGRDRQRDTQDEHVEERGGAAHLLDENDGHDHHDGDGDDDEAEHLAGAIELPLQRRRLRSAVSSSRPAMRPISVLHAGRGDDRLAVAVGRRRAAEEHVVAIAERRPPRDRRGVLDDGQALAGQSGFGGLQRGRLDQPRVGGNGVAFLDEQDVARHDLRGGDAPALSAANDRRLSRRHAREGRRQPPPRGTPG